jgi:hypothetical protein
MQDPCERGRGRPGAAGVFSGVNLTGSLQLFRAAREAGVPRFVFSSTCAVHEAILDDRPLPGVSEAGRFPGGGPLPRADPPSIVCARSRAEVTTVHKRTRCGSIKVHPVAMGSLAAPRRASVSSDEWH